MLEVPEFASPSNGGGDTDNFSMRDALFVHDKRDKSIMSSVIMGEKPSQIKYTKNSLDQSTIYGTKQDSMMEGSSRKETSRSKMPFISRSIQDIPKLRCASQGGHDSYRFN